MNLKTWLLQYSESGARIVQERFKIVLEPRELAEITGAFMASFMMPARLDLMEKLEVKARYTDAEQYLQAILSMMNTDGIMLLARSGQPQLARLNAGEVDDNGAKKFWAQNILRALLDGGTGEPFCSELVKDLNMVEQSRGLSESRSTGLRDEEKEELRKGLSRSLIDTQTCLALLEGNAISTGPVL